MRLTVLQGAVPMNPGDDGDPIDALREGRAPPEEVLAWALRRFAGRSIIATTGFGMEGCMLVHLLAQLPQPVRVVYLDTHFLFEETLRLRDELVRRYPRLTFVNAGTMVSPKRQAELHGERLWERDPGLCCSLRKVEPMKRALAGVDVWITALRRGQTPERENTRFVEWDWQYQLIKLNPMAYLTRADVWSYVQRNGVPINELHERGYPSIGCTHCTSPVPGSHPADYSRDGRWRGQGRTECGLHRGTQSTPPTT